MGDVKSKSAPRSNPAPLGANLTRGGANFSLYSRNATAVELLLFDGVDQARPSKTFKLDFRNRSYHYWHTFIPKIKAGQIYAYRVHGPNKPSEGLRFDPTKVLLDPYGRAVVVPDDYDRGAAKGKGDNAKTAMKSVVTDPSDYDWEGDLPLRNPSARTIIYEMHVKGFTAHPSSGVAEDRRGTYAGLIEKIPYLRQLGITAVELLPIFQFDAFDAPLGLRNYWGYQPVSYFAPHAAYSANKSPTGPVNEFRDMVKALHKAGIEVILDVVFNHSAESRHTGPTLCFRGIDNPTYYILDEDQSRYADFSGCGNTLNANHPIVRRMICDSLRYWVEEMHVDGFRFDLASILTRDHDGNVLPNPPVLWDIESDPVLAGTKLIAEAWDAAGLYQVGSFVGDSWKEWNGRFRDDVRGFFRGEKGAVRLFADRIVGSADVYRHKNREPEQSINFVTCHDGFTLNDLVSYEEKHNEANGEKNKDGHDDNHSWNCGVEGPTDNPAVEQLRKQQIKNFLTTTLLSIGLPMIVMGDECRRTQQGNNNAYCQDNEISWFDWSLVEKHAEIHRFTKLLIERRLLRTTHHEDQRLSLNQVIETAHKVWHGVKLNEPDWSDNSRSVAFTTKLLTESLLVHFIFNANWDEQLFELPREVDNKLLVWSRWIDTSLPSPNDICSWKSAPEVKDHQYLAAARSTVVLISHAES
jgi:glycogen operon protein